MAVKRLEPYELGEIIKLRGPRVAHLTVLAPDGLRLMIPARNGTAELWLAQTGTWRYSWGDDLHEIEVVQPEPPLEPEPERAYTGPGA